MPHKCTLLAVKAMNVTNIANSEYHSIGPLVNSLFIAS